MREQDFKEFRQLLDSVCSLLSRGAYVPNAQNTALFFRAMSAHDIDTVRGALNAHVADPVKSKFPPTPGDLLGHISEHFARTDGRPGVEEAWAAVPQDEWETVVWTTEAAEAHGICASLLQAGDKVAARMAFKEAYARLVEAARRDCKPARWEASLGTDLEARKRVLLAAVKSGLLTQESAFDMCPALPMPKTLALAAPPRNESKAEAAKKALNELAAAKRMETTADPLGWAKALKTREQSGERLTEALKTAWREALDRAPAAAGITGAFMPIPTHLLPPGMRGQK